VSVLSSIGRPVWPGTHQNTTDFPALLMLDTWCRISITTGGQVCHCADHARYSGNMGRRRDTAKVDDEYTEELGISIMFSCIHTAETMKMKRKDLAFIDEGTTSLNHEQMTYQYKPLCSPGWWT
jgi:hypothetical protein